MNQGINKEEIIELVENLEIDYDEFWILSTSALVLRGMYDKAGDLDIAVTKKALEQLKSRYDLIPKGNGWYKINDKVECVLDTKEESKFEKYGKYNLESLEKYLNWLEKSNKEKDKTKLDIVKKYLEENK